MNDHNQPRETQYTLGENAVPVHITGTPYQLHNCRTHWPTALAKRLLGKMYGRQIAASALRTTRA